MSQQPQIIIFGCDGLGQEVALQLGDRGYQLMLVDNDETRLANALGRGFEVERLDYTDDDALRSIGIGAGVDVIFCMFTEAANNVFLTISARALDPELKIISVTESADSRYKLLAAGASKVIDFYEISATRIYELIKYPLIVETLEHTVFSTRDLDLAEVRIPAGSHLIGQVLDQLDLGEDYNLVLLGMIERQNEQKMVFACHASGQRVQTEDTLIVIGPLGEIQRLREALEHNPGKDILR